MAAQERINCPHCQSSIKSAGLAPGTDCLCPRCSKPFTVPGQSAPAAAPSTPSPTAPVHAVKAPSAPPSTPAAPAAPASLPALKIPASNAPQQSAVSIPSTSRFTPPGMSPLDATIANMTAPKLPVINEETISLDDLDPEILPATPSAPSAPAAKSAAPAEVTKYETPAPAPPPKRVQGAAAAQQEFSFLCQLCGTRIYAKPSEEGRTKACPDCYSPVVVPKHVEPVRKASTSMVESPMLSSIVKDQKPAPENAGTQTPSAATMSAMAGAYELSPEDADEGSSDFALSEPVDLSHVHNIQATPIRLPTVEEAQEADNTWNDRDYGVIELTGSPDDWKQSPFFLKVIDVLISPGVLLRSGAYAVAFGIVGYYLQLMAESSGSLWEVGFQISGIVMAPIVAVLFVSAMSSFIAMVTDTGNGIVDVELPGFESFDWMGRGFKGLVAFIVSLAPGAALFFMGGEYNWMTLVAPIVCTAILFPVVLGSMLKEDSWFHFLSFDLLRTIQSHSEKWIIFHLSGTFVLAPMVIGLLLYFSTSPAKLLFGLVMIVASFWLYARMLGRLYWTLSEASRSAPRPPRPADAPRPTSHPNQPTNPTNPPSRQNHRHAVTLR